MAAEQRLRGPWWFPRRHLSADQRRHVLSQLYFEGEDRRPFLRRFGALMSASVLISVFGLAIDSGPVVIGAMLVSPLTTPLLGLSTALVMAWPRRQLESLGTLALASIGGIALGWLTLRVLPEPGFVTLGSEELLSRTEPRLLDLAVAIVAGAAGAYVLVRREAISALPGVAIAVALVPPLATVGMTLELGRSDLAGEALLLYGTNLAGIVLSASVVMLLSGMRPATSEGRLPHRARLGLAGAALATVAVAVPLTVHTKAQLTEAIDSDDAGRAVDEWAAGTRLQVLGVDVEGGVVRVSVAGPSPPPAVEPLAEELSGHLEEPVRVTVGWTKRRLFEASSGVR